MSELLTVRDVATIMKISEDAVTKNLREDGWRDRSGTRRDSQQTAVPNLANAESGRGLLFEQESGPHDYPFKSLSGQSGDGGHRTGSMPPRSTSRKLRPIMAALT